MSWYGESGYREHLCVEFNELNKTKDFFLYETLLEKSRIEIETSHTRDSFYFSKKNYFL